MGQREQRARERKRAAASCMKLDAFLPPAKQNLSTSDLAPSIPAASIKSTGGQDVSVVVASLSISVAD